MEIAKKIYRLTFQEMLVTDLRKAVVVYAPFASKPRTNFGDERKISEVKNTVHTALIKLI